jgi:predicted deacylase
MALPPGYRGHGEVEAAIRELAGPRTRVATLGASVLGAPILATWFGPEAARTLSVVIAGLHAIEWIGVETALALAARLDASPPADRRVLVVPLANPDGYRAIEADLRRERRRFRRANANGVDLNRNWPTGFRRLPRLPFGWSWGGSHPCSEPEIAAIVRALDAEVAGGARVEAALSLHSFGRKLLVPWGARWRRPPRYDELHARARGVQQRLRERYSIAQVSRWVPGAFAHGMEIDDLHARYGACALLVECSLGGLSLDPESWLAGPFRWYNPRRPSVIASEITEAVDPFVRGG